MKTEGATNLHAHAPSIATRSSNVGTGNIRHFNKEKNLSVFGHFP
jgi:hypothetical protein